MTKIIGLFVCVLCTLNALAAQTPEKPQPEIAQEDVVRISTSLIAIPVSVLDRNGRFVPDLREEQFRVFEDGIEQQIAYFESADKPFTVALLLDVSDSTRFKLKDIQDAAAEFLDQLRPDDRMLVIAFDRYVKLMCETTSDR